MGLERVILRGYSGSYCGVCEMYIVMGIAMIIKGAYARGNGVACIGVTAGAHCEGVYIAVGGGVGR